DLAHAQRRRRLAPRTLDRLLPHLLEPRQVVDAGAADDAEHGFGHDDSRRRGFDRIATARSADGRTAGLFFGGGARGTKGSLPRAGIFAAGAALASPGATPPRGPPSFF